MQKKTRALFRDKQQFHLFVLLSMFSLFASSLLLYRLQRIGFDYTLVQSPRDLYRMRGIPTFLFLVWNLILAWIPYLLSLGLAPMYRWSRSRILICLILVAWLVFFPNAPYILTDLLHLKSRHPMPFWYDLMLIVSYAWTGLLLGFVSLMEAQYFLGELLPARLVRTLTFCAILLGSFGIYIGRFQRWNSWDIITNPFGLTRDIAHAILHPFAHASTLGIAVVLAGFLGLSYLFLITLTGRGSINRIGL